MIVKGRDRRGGGSRCCLAVPACSCREKKLIGSAADHCTVSSRGSLFKKAKVMGVYSKHLPDWGRGGNRELQRHRPMAATEGAGEGEHGAD